MPRLGEEVMERGIIPILEQLAQICIDYSGLPDVREITISEIRFFYRRLVPGMLKEQLKDIK